MSEEFELLSAGASLDAVGLIAQLALVGPDAESSRPRVVAAMIGSADGRAAVEGRAGEFDKHKAKPVIVVCADGSRASKAAAALRAGGFANVVNLSGGLPAWQQAGLPVVK